MSPRDIFSKNIDKSWLNYNLIFHMGARRVVVTGMGSINCLGGNVESSWSKLITGKSGISELNSPEFDKIPAKIAGLVKLGENEGYIDPSKIDHVGVTRNMSKSTLFGLRSILEAMKDAKWNPSTEEEQNYTGVCFGSSFSCTETIRLAVEAYKNKGFVSVSPYFIPKTIINILAGHASIRNKLKGPNIACSSAFATGAHSLGTGFRYVKHGMAKVIVAGSAEAPVIPWMMAGFCKIKSLCVEKDIDPTQCSRPFDQFRKGFVMSEGAACLVLEELDHALRRNANIYAEILGFGSSSDSISLTAPCLDGSGAVRSMTNALREANVNPSCVGYVNAHATSTRLGDRAENEAIGRVFSPKMTKVSSIKGSLGHSLGASGSIESLMTCLACQKGVIPPTLNLVKTEEGFDFDYVPRESQIWSNNQRRIAVKNSFGFGGTNVSLCISNYLP